VSHLVSSRGLMSTVIAVSAAFSALGAAEATAAPRPSPAVAEQIWKLAPNVPVGPTAGSPCHRATDALLVWKREARGRQWGLINLYAAECSNGTLLVARRTGSSQWIEVTSFGYMPVTPCSAFKKPAARVNVPGPIMRRLTELFSRCGQHV
jgi:hypothetical protein